MTWHQTEEHEEFGNLFLAGERVTPGVYKQLGGEREIRLDEEDVLPGSLDGRVACYMRVNYWGSKVEARV